VRFSCSDASEEESDGDDDLELKEEERNPLLKSIESRDTLAKEAAKQWFKKVCKLMQ
jgi:hypothetical protein